MTTTQTKARKVQPKPRDLLDELVAGDALEVIAIMLWKERHRQPDLFVRIDEQDIRGFQDCVRYLEVKPSVVIARPQGLPAQQAIPASPGRRAVPGREATPPKPYVMVKLVEQGTDNTIRPVENNQEDFDLSRAAAAVRKARDQAPMLAERLMAQARSGETSLSDMQDAADALLILARAA